MQKSENPTSDYFGATAGQFKKLKVKFPSLFQGTRTRIYIDKGWYPKIKELCSKLDYLNNHHDFTIRITSMKYYTGGDLWIDWYSYDVNHPLQKAIITDLIDNTILVLRNVCSKCGDDVVLPSTQLGGFIGKRYICEPCHFEMKL